MIDPIDNDDDIFGSSSTSASGSNSLPSYLDQYIKDNPNLLKPLPHKSKYPPFVDSFTDLFDSLQRYVTPSRAFQAHFATFNTLDEITGGRLSDCTYNFMLQSQVELHFLYIKFYNSLYVKIEDLPTLAEDPIFQEVMRLALTYVKIFQFSLDKVIEIYRQHCAQMSIEPNESLIETGVAPDSPANHWYSGRSSHPLLYENMDAYMEAAAWKDNSYVNIRVDHFIQTLYNKLHSPPTVAIEIVKM